MRPCGFRLHPNGRRPGGHHQRDGHNEAGWFSHVRLYRDSERGRVKGVCAGIAAYFGISPLFIRIPWLFSLFINPVVSTIVYFVLAWLLPVKPADLFASEAEEDFWTQVRTEPVGTVNDLRHRFRGAEARPRAMEAYVTSPEFELNRELRDL